ncbi:MAG TPA: ABC transporter permease [Solirubrobacteraceae bacterium]|jgi:ribose transport system permease protein|nr:ABC transporter permease [Solirubrobacteraceae bacterium]
MTTNVDESAEAAPPTGPSQRSGNRSGLFRIFNARMAEASLLPFAFVLVIAGFGIARPDTFFQWSNFTSIFGLNSVELVLVMALLIPLTNGDLDLSVAELSGMTAILVGWLNVNQHWAIVPAILVALAVGILCGAINGWIIVRFDVNPFIITLATGSVFDGIAFWLPDQQSIPGISPHLADWTVLHHVFTIPLDFWYGIVIMLIMFYVLTFTPFGQRSLFVGQSREVARLSGFRVNSTRFWAFVAAGFIAAISGVISDGVLGSATPQNQGTLLLSVYAAAFLGFTTIQPGRFNAIGAGISVFFLAVAVNGMNLLGAQTYVQSLFYGVFLVLAVVLSRVINRRRAASAAKATT